MLAARRNANLGVHGEEAPSPCAKSGEPRCEGAEMPLAAATYSYPLLNIFWTMFVFFVWVTWIWLLIMVFFDIFRSHDLSGLAKAGWILFVFLIPLIGLLTYLIVRGGDMHERAEQRAQRQYDVLASSTSASNGSGGTTADQLRTLADVRDRGAITPEEFEREKAKILA
jgi:hypothetical protein